MLNIGDTIETIGETLGGILGFEAGPEDLAEARLVADEREWRVGVGVETLKVAAQIADQDEALEMQVRAATEASMGVIATPAEVKAEVTPEIAPVVNIETAASYKTASNPTMDIEEARRRVQAA